MRKLLLLLSLLFPAWCFAQTGSKPDFIRTPNSNFTIVDWNFKAKTFNLPHYSSITRRPSQDSLGTMFLSTVDQHIYIKKQVGSLYYPLAFLSDIPTFTNDFKKTGTLVGFADTLHRTVLPWTIFTTSGTNPALVTSSNGTSIQNWNSGGTNVAGITNTGVLKTAGIQNLISPFNSAIATRTDGTIISRGIADASPTLRVVNNIAGANGQLFQVQNYSTTFLNVDAFGAIIHKPISVAVSGNAKGYWMLGGLKPTANGDKLVGLQVEPVYGTSTVNSTTSLVGGSGYPNGTYYCNTTGGTGSGLVAQITVSGGVVTAYTITDFGINYTNGDVVSFLVLDGSGAPIGSGGTFTVNGVTTYTGVIPISAEFKNAPIQLDPITTPSVLQSGMIWQNGTHLFGFIGGATRQLDQQIGVSSIFGRNGNVVAQSGDYLSSQITESGSLFFTNERVLTAPITGYSAGAGTITSADNIIQAINKLSGNIAASVTGVSSFNSRGGAVVPVAGDYSSLTETLTNKNITSGTNTFPTFNQNTTGTAASAATFTTPRTINGVSFNGSANITITANNPNSLLNGFAILGGSYNGGSAITLRVDTNAGKVATQWKIDSTANAHGASAGIGINSTLFAAGTVGVDTAATIVSKAFLAGYTYTKAQVQSTALNFTALHTHTFNSIGVGNTDALLLTNTTAATNVLNQYSPDIHFNSPYWTGSASAASDFIIHNEAGLLVFKGALNGGALNTLGYFSVTAGGGSQFILPNTLLMNQSFNGATRTDALIIRNNAASSSGNPNQISSSVVFGNSVWNTSGTPAANYGNFSLQAVGTSSGTPTVRLSIQSSLQTTTTPSYTEVASVDNSGNIAGKSVRGAAVTFANLPVNPVEGMMVPVTDSSVNTWGTTITGGGANHVLAYYNGSAWTCAAK